MDRAGPLATVWHFSAADRRWALGPWLWEMMGRCVIGLGLLGKSLVETMVFTMKYGIRWRLSGEDAPQKPIE